MHEAIVDLIFDCEEDCCPGDLRVMLEKLPAKDNYRVISATNEVRTALLYLFFRNTAYSRRAVYRRWAGPAVIITSSWPRSS